MTLLAESTAPSQTLTLIPRLTRRGTRFWLSPGFGASTAYINLSPGLVSVFSGSEEDPVSHQTLGLAGLTAHQAWNAAAAELAPRASCGGHVEFHVRCPTVTLKERELPRGFEVDGHGAPAAAWLAHPRTFTLLHNHFLAVMDPQEELAYMTRDDRDLYVFDARPMSLARIFPRAAVMTYSVGFPLLHGGSPLQGGPLPLV